MKIFTLAPGNHQHSSENPVYGIPDVTDWMYEHHFLVRLVEAVNAMKEVLTEAGSREYQEFSSTPDGKLILTQKAKDVLRSHCPDEQWAYLQNYLLE